MDRRLCGGRRCSVHPRGTRRRLGTLYVRSALSYGRGPGSPFPCATPFITVGEDGDKGTFHLRPRIIVLRRTHVKQCSRGRHPPVGCPSLAEDIQGHCECRRRKRLRERRRGAVHSRDIHAVGRPLTHRCVECRRLRRPGVPVTSARQTSTQGMSATRGRCLWRLEMPSRGTSSRGVSALCAFARELTKARGMPEGNEPAAGLPTRTTRAGVDANAFRSGRWYAARVMARGMIGGGR